MALKIRKVDNQLIFKIIRAYRALYMSYYEKLWYRLVKQSGTKSVPTEINYQLLVIL